MKLKRVSISDAEEIRRYLLPLPHELSVEYKATLPLGDVGITLKSSASDSERKAIASLRQLFKDKADVEVSGEKFEILVGIVDDDKRLDGITAERAKRLREVHNHEQAYLILPSGETRLVVAGLNEKGLRYGIMTLCQLIDPHISADAVPFPW